MTGGVEQSVPVDRNQAHRWAGWWQIDAHVGLLASNGAVRDELAASFVAGSGREPLTYADAPWWSAELARSRWGWWVFWSITLDVTRRGRPGAR